MQIEIECDVCGESLTASYRIDRSFDFIISVEPCTVCNDKLRSGSFDEGYAQGKTDGNDDAYDKGYQEGLEEGRIQGDSGE